MKTKTLVILILVALVAVLLLQNAGLTPLRIFFWNVYAPLFVLVLTVFFLGALVGFLLAMRGRKKEPKAVFDKTAPPVSSVQPPLKPQP
jgi:uncharacterized integral membrane protein